MRMARPSFRERRQFVMGLEVIQRLGSGDGGGLVEALLRLDWKQGRNRRLARWVREAGGLN
jgi:hypothetical protein